MQRQISAPPATAQGENVRQTSTLKKIGRSVKHSVADFFGLGDELPDQNSRWQNRRYRYYGGKIKDGKLPRVTDFDELDSSIPHIYDPLRVHGKHSMASQRTTPLSSTSTYRSIRGFPQRRTRKDSVLKMTFKGLQTITSTRKKLRQKPDIHSRSYAPASLAGDVSEIDFADSYAAMPHEDQFSLVDDVFYDEPVFPAAEKMLETLHEEAIAPSGAATSGSGDSGLPKARWKWPEPGMDEVDLPGFARMERIRAKILNSAQERDRRQYGMGFVGRLFNRSYRSDRMDSYVKKQLDEMDDHRPFFTYWVTFVQIVCFIVSVAVYRIAPIGSSETVYTEFIKKPNLAYEMTRYVETDNLWIGPRQADLIHLGAKYSPCMRPDREIIKGLNFDRAEEKESACCIRDDGSGCFQAVSKKCSKTLNTWDKWNATNTGPGKRTSGTVCGQDPRYCKNPSSVAPFEWEDNINKWPLCKETSKPNATIQTDRHMSCEISGRPCCHGIQGECMITTREHCNFVRGYYHEEAFLCSQVSCMKDICGMIPFSEQNTPDQFYRLWTSLFLHGGLFHLIITIGFQILIMRDMEKLTGAIRMAIIYMGSGIAGNLASCIFVPYQVDVGPAGAQFGILACLFVEVLQSFQMLKKPGLAVLKITIPILVLFLLGLLPWIDNWAHTCGFIFGILIAFAILPYVSFGQWDRRRKIIGIVISLGGCILLFVLLVLLFYVVPLYSCPGCQYFDCIPFTENFCKNMEININRESTYSNV
ncbi:hypothetical protein CHS0354_025672 [Potamilus streckersoni]|uniref:Peptidase S54 rhomboid domain-containing protein n=1 Tax=Potamilus streckersoni TaxID=2493646 RepID=A0AAE0S6J4_9BIVA|nr:hypothetical protein CHS0354_025672 [Potamilus streckersoni]